MAEEKLEKQVEELTQKVEKHGERIALMEERPEPASTEDIISEVEGRMKGKGGLNLTSILLTVAIAGLVTYIMIGWVGVSKTWFNETIAPVLNELSGTYATNAELENYVTKGDFSSFVTQDALGTTLNDYATQEDLAGVDLSGYVAEEDYDAIVASLEARLSELEEEKAAEEGVAGDAVTVDPGYSKYITYPKEDGALEQTIFLDVENNLDVDLMGVEIQLTLHSRGVSIPFELGLCDVTEGFPLQWEKVHVGSGLIVLQGITPAWGDGLEIDAEDNESVYLTLVLGDSDEFIPINDTRLYIEAECTDYEVVE